MPISETPFYIALLAFIPGLINIGLFVYAYYFLPKSKLTVVFSGIAISAAIWQLGDGFLRSNINIELAYKIMLINSISVLFLVTSCFQFSLLFLVERKNKFSPILTSFFYAITFLFVFANLLNWIPTKLEYSSVLGYFNNPTDLYFSIESIYISVVSFCAAFIFVYSWVKQPIKNERIKIGLITVGYLIPFVQGITTEIIFPELLDLKPIPLTTTSITFLSIASIIALKKYNLFSFSPYKVSDSIVNLMSDAVLISDNNGVIKYVNPSLARMLKYTPDELIGKQGYFMLANSASIEKVSSMIEERKKGKSNRYEVSMKTKDGMVLNVIINAAPYFINNKIIGALAVIHDITDEKIKVNRIKEAIIIGEEKERLRLSKELHDGIAQNIAVIKMSLQAIEANELSYENQAIFNDVSKLTQDTLKEIRDISHNLHPLKEGELLCEAIKRLVDINKHNNIRFDFSLTGNKPTVPISNIITTNLYRVLQEFINNTVKHAEASLITINLKYTHENIEIMIKDNGIGSELGNLGNKEIKHGIGMLNMQQRIKAIDGTFNYSTKKNQGTRLIITVPITP
ncbi:MAG: PAS domain S-box protein [Flavobacteriales bacterium]